LLMFVGVGLRAELGVSKVLVFATSTCAACYEDFLRSKVRVLR